MGALKNFRCIGTGLGGLMKRASEMLTICSKGTETEVTASSTAEMRKILGCEPPPHSMMAMVNKLTTPREDRDGDTLQTAGARIDPKAPLLWQHVHTLPIGKMVRVVSHDKDCLKVATVLLDINELTADCGKMFEAGVLRFSHGFIAKRFEERKGGGLARFDILEFDIVEESAVSVPSNVDAEVELFCRGKLSSFVMKSHAKSLFDARKKSMAVTAKVKEAVGDKKMVIQQKLDSPVGDMTMGGPTPNHGEAQDSFMQRCMLDSVMMDQYPTQGNRQQACTIQWGKSIAPATKEMGKCKECGKQEDLGKDGMCAACSKGKDDDGDEANESAGADNDSGDTKKSLKAGRVLSQRNVEVLSDAVGDLDALLQVMDLPRSGKALGSSAKNKVKSVIDGAIPGEDSKPSINDHVLRDAIMVVSVNRDARMLLKDAIKAFDEADENDKLAEEFRKLESVLTTG